MITSKLPPLAGKPSAPVRAAHPIISTMPDTSGTLTHGFIQGLRPGQPLHVLLSPGGCNTTVVQNVIVPDFLPPSFTGLKRQEDSVLTDQQAALRGVNVCTSNSYMF